MAVGRIWRLQHRDMPKPGSSSAGQGYGNGFHLRAPFGKSA